MEKREFKKVYVSNLKKAVDVINKEKGWLNLDPVKYSTVHRKMQRGYIIKDSSFYEKGMEHTYWIEKHDVL